jgi:hypothetical protein
MGCLTPDPRHACPNLEYENIGRPDTQQLATRSFGPSWVTQNAKRAGNAQKT